MESETAFAVWHNGKLPARGSDMGDRRPFILHDLHLHPWQWGQQTRWYPGGPPKLRNSIDRRFKSILEENVCYSYWWWRRWWCSWWRWHWAWKSGCTTVRFVRMFKKSWTWRIQNLGFEGVQISLCCRTQWKLTRPRLRSEREETHHLAWSSFVSM